MIVVSLVGIDTMSPSVKLCCLNELNQLTTGAQMPLYLTLHVIVMTSYSCTATEADRFVEQVVSLSVRETTFRPLCRVYIDTLVTVTVILLNVNQLIKQS